MVKCRSNCFCRKIGMIKMLMIDRWQQLEILIYL